MFTSRALLPLVAPALYASACASVPHTAGFADVQAMVVERAGQRIHWNQGGSADAEVEAHLDQLLAHELTADAAVQIALLNNRDLQSTYEELGIAQADLVEAGLLENPVFETEFRFRDGGGPVEVELAVTEDFLSILFLPLRERIAEAAFESAKLRVAGAVLDLAASARSSFYELQGAEQLLDLRRAVVTATEASSELARRLHEAGNIRDLDLAAEQALHEQALVDLSAAELEVVMSRERLTALMGLWGQRTSWTASARLPELSTEPLELSGMESRAIERSLDLAAARWEMEQVARRLGLTRTSVIAGESSIGASAERDGDGDWSIGPAFQLPISLFNQGQPALARATATMRALQNNYSAQAVRVRSELRATASRVLTLKARAQHYRDVIIPLRHRVLEETQKQYNAMQVGAFQLLDAKQREIEAGGQYVEALRDYWIARTELDQILSGGQARGDDREPRPVQRGESRRDHESDD